jgi:hypothetical protein
MSRRSWRDFWKVHPACDAFPPMTPAERRELADSIDKNGVLVPIQTRHVAGPDGGRNYLIDGQERLDVMETILGWQIVNNEGEWYGALALIPGAVPKVEHRMGRTDSQIASEVIALNACRRHQTQQRLIESIDRALRLQEYNHGE